jgi:hypothetical protein
MQPDNAISRDSTVTVTQVQVSCEVNGETVILHFDSGNYFGLNDVGTLVWKMMEQPRSVRELRDAILSEYDVEPEQCERELLDLLKELRERELIEVRSLAAAPRSFVFV